MGNRTLPAGLARKLAPPEYQCHVPPAKMLPERKRDTTESGARNGGFEVRVIGGSAPAAVELAQDTAPGVEVGVVIGGGAPRARHQANPDEGPVLRLEADDQGEPLKARDMSEVGPAVPRTGSRSGKKKRDRLQQLTLWMAIGVFGIAIVAVGVLMAGKKADQPKEAIVEGAAPLPVDAAAVERDRFVAEAGKLIDEAEETLRRFAGAKTADEALSLVRDPERVKPGFFRKWKAWGVDPAFARSQVFASIIDTAGLRPSIVVTGTKGDFSPFRAVFVRDEGKILLDWEATTGAGDLDITDLKAGKEAKDAIVRAVISAASYYTPNFPETKYGSYRLTDESGEHLVWAYAEIESPVAKALNLELNEGSFLMDKNSSIVFTLRVDGPGQPGSNQYRITEMLHKGWVSP